MNADPNQHRKVYAKGFFDGVEAANRTMTPTRYQATLSGQTSVAKKVYEHVPALEAWTAIQISQALTRATKSQMDFKILQGCLKALRESGLIRETQRGMFQRVDVKEKLEEPLPRSEPAKSVVAPISPSAPMAAPTKTPIEILSEISARVVALNGELKKIASDIETAAIVIEEGMAENEENLGKLKQLQSILKSLT
jgi:predicted transcriptional regulator